jgi:hypothetical protein
MSIALLCTKDQASEAIRRFQLKSEAETGKRLGVLRTDRGGEFNSENFSEYHSREWDSEAAYDALLSTAEWSCRVS